MEHRAVAIDDDERILDLVEAREATEEEVRCAIDSERPAPRTPRTKPVPPPTYRVIERAPDDNASRLGFVVGSSEMTPIKVGERWTVCAFHLASGQIAGRLAVSLSIHPMAGQSLQVKLFDARGTCLLSLDMQSNTIAFDQRRFSSGDYLIAWRSPGPGVEGTGRYRAPHARLLDQLPEQPILDELTLSDAPDASLGECGVPRFKFSAK